MTARRLRERGIERLVDVRAAGEAALREAVGSQTEWLRQLAQGVDDRPVVPNRAAKSCGSENTFSQDLTSLTEIRQQSTRWRVTARRGWNGRRSSAGR